MPRQRLRSNIGRHTRHSQSVRISRQNDRNQETSHGDDNSQLNPEQIQLQRPIVRALFYRLAFEYDPNREYSSHRKIVIGEMDKQCQYCNALKFKNETAGMCCAAGKIVLPNLNPPPEPLKTLISGVTTQSKLFLRKIRKFNSCFQMTSFGTTNVCQNQNNDGRNFETTFRIQGQIYHRIGSLLPIPSDNPKFLQIYFMGSEEEQANTRCDYNYIEHYEEKEIVISLQNFFNEHNLLIKLFKQVSNRLESDNYMIVIKADKVPSGEHPRRFNAPAIDEVAVVMTGDQFEQRDIRIMRRNNTLQTISDTHRCYDALQYPLIFWQGEDGYQINIKQRNPLTDEETNKNVSAMDYYSYRLMIRLNDDNHILKCRQLFQQYIVDMYIKIESERLRFIRFNQAKLRAEEYIHLRDAVNNSVEENLNTNDIGNLFILPSTYIGSPRHMQEYIQDAMTYVRVYGRPDLFITFTCNPKWDDIKKLLLPGQTAIHRHDIVARVFKQKLKSLINFIVKDHIYGETRCWMYSVEWQKRGLPHAHILIWIVEKIKPEEIDKIISAEIPDRNIDPELFEIVTTNMIHGPCGSFNMTSPCMENGKCTKGFPKNFTESTITGLDGYPLYRRRKAENGGYTHIMNMRNNNIVIDNTWVVPYSPILSKTFKAHINVEFCSSIKSIKYICKYIHKGSDMAVFGVANVNRNDEITQYQMGRYISSNEAIWRILSFHIHERDPAVIHLSVHLENGQRVYFNDENILERALTPPKTTLTEFFQLCKQNNIHGQFAKTLLYSEVPSYFTWNKQAKKWEPRKRGRQVAAGIFASNTLGRLYTIHPKQRECFYLRLLLITVRGPTSYEDLRTVNGVLFATNIEACRELKLLEGDNHWDITLANAELISSPHQIRQLFAILLTNCFPTNPSELWTKYRDAMTEDILHRNRRTHQDENIQFTSDMYNEALLNIEDMCISISNTLLINLGMPSPNRPINNIINNDIQREQQFNITDLISFVAANEQLLTNEQNIVYERIMMTISTNGSGFFFLDAPGGTGKTFLISLILSKVRSEGNIALAIASSGIAATMLDGGRTAHSALKLPLNIQNNANAVCNIKKNSAMAQVLKNCRIIIWDECTMAHKHSLEALNRTLQHINNNDRLFGGGLILLSGDFRQTLPVIPRSTYADEINACLKSSVLWRNIHTFKLTKNMRVELQNDSAAEVFSKQLLDIGNGTINYQENTQYIKLPENFCVFVDSQSQLIQTVFPDLNTNFRNHQWLCERAILAAKNVDVEEINCKIQETLPGDFFTFQSIDTMVDENEMVNYPTEFLNSLDIPGLAPHSLKLKIGSPIILLRNLNPPKLCNGTRLVIKKILGNVIEAIILTEKFKGESFLLPRIPMVPSDSPIQFKRLQFPIRLAFAISINKSQGQTMKICGIDLQNPCFSHGQLYVACSRVGNPSNLIIHAPGGLTTNIVHKLALE